MNIYSFNPYQNSRLDIFAKTLFNGARLGLGDYLLIDPYSIGDVFHTLVLLKAFRQKYCVEGQKIALVCNKRCSSTASLFKEVDCILTIDCGQYEFHFESLVERYRVCAPGQPYVMCIDMHARGWFSRLIAANRLSPIEGKALLLDLDISTPPNLPQFTEAQIAAASANAERQGVEAGSVIIFNHANTLKSLNPEVFLPLKERFGDKIHYDASVPGKGEIPWAKPITMEFIEIPLFADIAGSVINIRSGVTDILSLSHAKKVTIYPSVELFTDGVPEPELGVQAFKSFTLEKMHLDDAKLETPIFLESGMSSSAIANAIRETLKIGF